MKLTSILPDKYLLHYSKEYSMGIEELDKDKLGGWANFINNLTAKKIFLTIALAIGLSFAYGLYEQKAGLIELVSEKPVFMIALVGGGLLASLGFTFTSLQTRIDDKSKEIHKELRMRLADQKESHEESINCLEVQLKQINDKERQCTEQYHSLTLQLAKKGFFKDGHDE